MRTPRPDEYTLVASASGEAYESANLDAGSGPDRTAAMAEALLDRYADGDFPHEPSTIEILAELPGAMHRISDGVVLIDSALRAEAQVWRKPTPNAKPRPTTVVRVVETVETTWDLTSEQLAAVGQIDPDDADSVLGLIDSGIEPRSMAVLERDIVLFAELGEEGAS